MEISNVVPVTLLTVGDSVFVTNGGCKADQIKKMHSYLFCVVPRQLTSVSLFVASRVVNIRFHRILVHRK